MENKIAIIITTFQRDELLFKSVESLIPYLQDHWRIIIVDQGIQTQEKKEWLFDIRFTIPDLIRYETVPFNSGLSYCRNIGVQIAKDLNCNYVLLSSDSFLFNESLKFLPDILSNTDYDCIGFELNNCKCGWEAKLSLHPDGFELNFIDKSIEQGFYDCDIIRNFFLATTESINKTKWDNDLKLCEHEDFFYRYKRKGYKVGWTPLIDADKMTERPKQYADFRKKNFDEGMQNLRKKYKIAGWISYKNLEQAKKGLK